MDIAYLVRRAARHAPNTLAVDDGSTRRTIGALASRAERFANALDTLGVPPGARIAILSPNRAEYPEVDVGIAFGRRVRVALNTRLHLLDHQFVIGDADVQVLVHSGEHAETAALLQKQSDILTISFDKPSSGSPSLYYEKLLAETSDRTVVRGDDAGDEGPAWITYTSGTTGRPKGIVLSYRAIREVALNLLGDLRPVDAGELLVLPQPLSHGAGYWVIPSLISHAGIYVPRKFDPEELYRISRLPNVRTLKCVPAMLPPLIELDGDFGYDTVIYGASPMPRPVLEAALDRFGPVLVEIYGQSEAPVTLTWLGKADHLGSGDRRFSAGRAFRAVGVEVRSDDGATLPHGQEGEVAVTGSHLMSCYLGMPEETAAVFRDGWVLTRDVGVLDEYGFLQLLGRRDEMIISGGYNISPRDVENVLSQFPGVEEVAVAGIPHDRWGSVVAAAIKLADGVLGATPEEVIEFARPRLDFRTPRQVQFVDNIPKNAYGKVDRLKLAEALAPDREPAR